MGYVYFNLECFVQGVRKRPFSFPSIERMDRSMDEENFEIPYGVVYLNSISQEAGPGFNQMDLANPVGSITSRADAR